MSLSRRHRQSVLENPRATLGLLAEARKPRGPKPKEATDPQSLALQRLSNALTMLFRLTGEAEVLLATLAAQDKQVLKPMLLQCAQALWRFSQLAKTSCAESGFSPGKKEPEEVVQAHGHRT